MPIQSRRIRPSQKFGKKTRSPTFDCSFQMSSVLLLVIFCTAIVTEGRLPWAKLMRGRSRLPVVAPISPSAPRRLMESIEILLLGWVHSKTETFLLRVPSVGLLMGS
ncbi:hypothetical protein D3C72_1852890 [compost metagenome]